MSAYTTTERIAELRARANRIRESAQYADRYHDYFQETQQAARIDAEADELEKEPKEQV